MDDKNLKEKAAENKAVPSNTVPKGKSSEGKKQEYKSTNKTNSTIKKPAPKATEKSGTGFNKEEFNEKYWRPWLWPVCTLVGICLVVSILLAVVNDVTLPIIQENESKTAEKIRGDLLPQADGFEDMLKGAELPQGIKAAYAATNGTGFVVESYAKGYGGDIPAIVAFDAEGKIVGVKFTENDETPGLGQKVYSDKSFAENFKGLGGTTIGADDVDKISSATISTGAAIKAVNTAVEFIGENALGTTGNLSEGQILTKLFAGAAMAAPVEMNVENVTQAWFGDNGNFVIYATANGYYDDKLVTAAVGMDENGVITGVWLDTSEDTDGLGSEVGKNQNFIDSFAGKTSSEGIDAVTSATFTSEGVFKAVQTALDALPYAKDGATGEFVILPSLPISREEHDNMNEAEILEWLLPGQNLKEVSGVGTKAYKGNNGYVIFDSAEGYGGKDVTVIAAVNQNGEIINLWLDTSTQTDGLGTEVQYNSEFIASFKGHDKNSVSEVDVVATATISSEAVKEAAKNALDYFDKVKEAG